MAKFKKGEEVKLIAVVPEGPVLALRMDEDGNVQYLIGWTDADGVEQQRWFDEDQLVAVV
jgi:YD repeat-containing protein